jgi:LacI family transcriptional regulator
MTRDLEPDATRRGQLARMADIAALASVSPATVDRVLHHRPGVRAATSARVMKAAVELGYVPDSALDAFRAPRPARLVLLLPAGGNQFFALLGRTATALAHELGRRFNATVRPVFVEGFRPELLARELLVLGKAADGIAFMAIEHPAVREAVDELARRGVPTVTLISDLAGSGRSGYLGLENRSAGRTAAALIARFIGKRPAKVAMIAGSRSYRAHEEREAGFLHFFEEMAPAITVVGLREGLDDDTRNYRHARTLLGEHQDLAAIYNIGGAPEGVARGLKEVGRERDVVFVGHGLTPGTRRLLLDGTLDVVLTQDPRETMLGVASVFSNLRLGLEPMAGIARMRTEIVLRENLP